MDETLKPLNFDGANLDMFKPQTHSNADSALQAQAREQWRAAQAREQWRAAQARRKANADNYLNAGSYFVPTAILSSQETTVKRQMREKYYKQGKSHWMIVFALSFFGIPMLLGAIVGNTGDILGNMICGLVLGAFISPVFFVIAAIISLIYEKARTPSGKKMDNEVLMGIMAATAAGIASWGIGKAKSDAARARTRNKEI